MTCQDLKGDLVAYVDGGLNDVRAESVRTHLAACAPCRTEVRAIQGTLDAASAYRIPPLSRAAGIRMLAGVRERLAHQRRRRVYRLVPAFGVAALALAFVVVGVRDRRAPGTTLPAQESSISLPADTRATSVTEDPELFEAVMDRLVQVEIGDPVSRAGEGSKASLRSSATDPATLKVSGPASLWQAYQQRPLQGERMESLLKDLSDEEFEQVLQKVEEKLSV